MDERRVSSLGLDPVLANSTALPSADSAVSDSMAMPVEAMPAAIEAATASNHRSSRMVALLWVVVIAIIIFFAFFASSLCITFLLAGFLAILADPIPTYLERWHITRSLSSAVLVFGGMVILTMLVYASYGKVGGFIDDIPEYAARIQDAIKPLRQNIEKVQKSAGSLNPMTPPQGKRIQDVRINEPPSWPSYLIRGVGSVWGAIIIGGVVPFLMFFMLVRKAHLYNWVTNAFGASTDVPRFADRLSRMVQGFVVGNVVIATIMAAVTVAVLLSLKMPGAVVLGVASALLNLIPFLGVILAAAVPMLPAMLQFDTPGPFLIILFTVVALHFISANILIPRVIGSRVNIGPVAATVGMLFWGWLWGIMGVLLAVPLTAFVKLVSDCHPSLIHISNLLAEKPQPLPQWAQIDTRKVVRSIPFLGKRMQTTVKDKQPRPSTSA
jgi:predicted PurR-regulated permease PerM